MGIEPGSNLWTQPSPLGMEVRDLSIEDIAGSQIVPSQIAQSHSKDIEFHGQSVGLWGCVEPSRCLVDALPQSRGPPPGCRCPVP